MPAPFIARQPKGEIVSLRDSTLRWTSTTPFQGKPLTHKGRPVGSVGAALLASQPEVVNPQKPKRNRPRPVPKRRQPNKAAAAEAMRFIAGVTK